MYKSQIESYDYMSMCKGLNAFRGAINKSEYCEVYYSRRVAKMDRKRKMLLRWWGMVPTSLRVFLKKIRA